MDNEFDVENFTKEDWEAINRRLKAVGMPELIIDGDMVYKDEIHKLLGIGYKIGT